MTVSACVMRPSMQSLFSELWKNSASPALRRTLCSPPWVPSKVSTPCFSPVLFQRPAPNYPPNEPEPPQCLLWVQSAAFTSCLEIFFPLFFAFLKGSFRETEKLFQKPFCQSESKKKLSMNKRKIRLVYVNDMQCLEPTAHTQDLWFMLFRVCQPIMTAANLQWLLMRPRQLIAQRLRAKRNTAGT